MLAAALRLADEQGLEAATVHAVARCPHATPMALHRHRDDKKALLDALAEQLLTAYSLLAADGRPHEPLVALAGIKDNARSIPPPSPAADLASSAITTGRHRRGLGRTPALALASPAR